MWVEYLVTVREARPNQRGGLTGHALAKAVSQGLLHGEKELPLKALDQYRQSNHYKLYGESYVEGLRWVDHSKKHKAHVYWIQSTFNQQSADFVVVLEFDRYERGEGQVPPHMDQTIMEFYVDGVERVLPSGIVVAAHSIETIGIAHKFAVVVSKAPVWTDEGRATSVVALVTGAAMWLLRTIGKLTDTPDTAAIYADVWGLLWNMLASAIFSLAIIAYSLWKRRGRVKSERKLVYLDVERLRE